MGDGEADKPGFAPIPDDSKPQFTDLDIDADKFVVHLPLPRLSSRK